MHRHHQPPGRDELGSVGQPVDGMELWIADDGELLVRGPLVMAGYRDRRDLTAQAIDADGWLHTGDVGRVDDDGYLWIVDRKKELIINAAGKNISPANIEALLKSSGPLIGQACVVGDRRPYIVALLVLDPDTAAGLDPADADVVARVREEVDARQRAPVARGAGQAASASLAAEWLPGGDELTPTMKLKRRPIAEKYAGEIDAPLRLDSRYGMAERRLHGLQRVLGVNALFSTAYGNVGSSIYYALGLVASLRARPDAGRLHHHRRHLLPDRRHLRRGDGDVPGGGRLVELRAPRVQRVLVVLRRLGADAQLRDHDRHLGVLRAALPRRRCSGTTLRHSPGDIIVGDRRDRRPVR